MPHERFRWQPGDIAACYGGDIASRVISLATTSLVAPRHLKFAPSHVAIIAPHREYLRWWESTTFCREPCLELLAPVSGVQVHEPESRVHDYLSAGGTIDVYRLNEVDQLGDYEMEDLEAWLLRHFVGKRYDYRGAAVSGTRVWSRLRWFFNGGGVESLFCSEMLALLLMRLGRLNRQNPGWFHPGRLMRSLVRTGVYRRVERLQRAEFRGQESGVRRAA